MEMMNGLLCRMAETVLRSHVIFSFSCTFRVPTFSFRVKYGAIMVETPSTQNTSATKKCAHFCSLAVLNFSTTMGSSQPGSMEPSVVASEEMV